VAVAAKLSLDARVVKESEGYRGLADTTCSAENDGR
jgi:hypothetical protein